MAIPKSTLTLKDILEIENDEEILSFRCPVTRYLAWPLIRDNFYLFIMGTCCTGRRFPLIFKLNALENICFRC